MVRLVQIWPEKTKRVVAGAGSAATREKGREGEWEKATGCLLLLPSPAVKRKERGGRVVSPEKVKGRGKRECQLGLFGLYFNQKLWRVWCATAGLFMVAAGVNGGSVVVG
ncbi:hypothetical protein HAX54_008319 [Datura stramonium]|uniref:Uncharacterized protein n=1 Tax=Datura stramonium TaxID=4076 RepID=A0ABS8TEK2_DATST|nr:hypothetical protein [Datura stramonium]